MVGLVVAQTPQIEFAPREKLRFVEHIEQLVLKLLRHPEALVSDESTLWDFCINDADDAIGPGKGWASYLFKRKFYRGKALDGLRNETLWQEVEYEARAVPFKQMTIRKILRNTGVDIAPVFDEYLPVIFQYIAARISRERSAVLSSG